MFLEPSLSSIIIATLRGGKLKNLGDTYIKGWYLLILSSILQAVLAINKAIGISLINNILNKNFVLFIAISYILLVIVAIMNIKKRYMLVLLIGIILNFLVIMANEGQMPVSTEGIKGINKETYIENRSLDVKHIAVTKDTRLVYLSDIILIDRPYPLPKVISIGDVFLMLGLFMFFQEEMVKRNQEISHVS